MTFGRSSFRNTKNILLCLAFFPILNGSDGLTRKNFGKKNKKKVKIGGVYPCIYIGHMGNYCQEEFLDLQFRIYSSLCSFLN